MEFYDAHLHILFKCRPSDLQNRLDFLKGIGVKGFCAIITPEFPGDVNTIREMIPEVYYSIQDLEVLCKQEHILPIIRQVTNPDIIPYIDARYIGTDIERKMEKYHGQGYVGLKLLYVPEEDNVSKIHGMARAFGRPPAESERITADLIACTARYGMPVLIHLDLSKIPVTPALTAMKKNNVVFVYMEETIADLPRILINAGSRGLLTEMSASELIRVLDPIPVKVSVGS